MKNITLFNNIQKEMILQFTNRYINKTNIDCNKLKEFFNENSIINCTFNYASIQDIKNNIINSLTYAIEKYLDMNVLNILENDITLLNTIGNNNTSIKYTLMENNNIRNKIYIEIENSITNENIFEIIQTIKKNLVTNNNALLFIKEDLIINTINKIINAFVQFQANLKKKNTFLQIIINIISIIGIIIIIILFIKLKTPEPSGEQQYMQQNIAPEQQYQ